MQLLELLKEDAAVVAIHSPRTEEPEPVAQAAAEAVPAAAAGAAATGDAAKKEPAKKDAKK